MLAVLVALAVAAAAVWYFAIRDDNESAMVHGSGTAPFSNGIVVINVEPPSKASLAQLSKQLQAKLSEQIPDFELVKAHTVQVRAGPALSISYARTQKGTANTLLVVPAAGHLYTLNAVVPAGQEGAAKEAGSILSSFDA